MWEMQQLWRRAGALEIDLMSKQPGKQKSKLLSSLLGVVLEKRWKMFEGRAVQAVRGDKSFICEDKRCR